MADNSKHPKPPQAPKMKRQLEFYPWQIFGVAMLLLIVALAVTGVLGHTAAEAEVEGDSVYVSLTYPERFRYKTVNEFEITIENTSDEALEGIQVEVDTGYISKFSGVSFTPSPARVTEDVYVFELSDVAPGGSRVVDGQVQAEEVGMHEGFVTVAPSVGDDVQVDFSTLVFP